jgi:A/G-specific adenine glycosylase
MNRAATPPEPLPVTDEKVQAVRAGILDWYRAGHRDLPWRHTRDPYAILVSEIMLQQTQVDRVIPKYGQFLTLYPTLEALAAAPRAEVIRSWAPLGYNLRAVRLHEIARQAVEQYGGRLPDTLDGLLSLRGIGPYTAGAVACFAFGVPAAAMDTNVRRVLGRIFAAEVPAAGAGDDRVAWRLAGTALPPAPADAYDWNQALMDLGATVCVSRTPRCLLCPAQTRCSARATWQPLPAAPLIAAVAEGRGDYAAASPPAAADGAPAGAPSADSPRRRRARTPAPRFEGSRRWFRGRIVDALRALPPGETLPLDSLGPQIKPDYAPADREWLLELATALAHDGLVAVAEDGGTISVSLPH